ncbi:MAG: acetoacetyl-CoA reductase [Bordetella sp.]|uniref:acetoacetyl-CoA reductase n=1 Tax=Bordetella sp. TaxID=28081 RepID=UPI003F7C9741
MNKHIALVTGGTRGLGRATSIALQQAGHRVVAVYHSNDTEAERFHAETGIPVYRWDISDFEACGSGVEQVEHDLGPIGVLVNNGGITRDTALHKMSLKQWQEVLRTNLDSHFNMCRHVIEGMRERRYGRIVNISSINGQKGQFGQTNYSASKAGILGFTRALALESAARGITVNAIAPGYCDTDMVAAVQPEVMKAIVAAIPVGRLGRAEDIARLVVFLAREDNDYITGATFSANGGQYLS